MSKITDRLSKLGQTARTGFGFGVRATNTKIPVILVGVRIDKPTDAKKTDADLYILAPGPKGSAQAGSVKDVDLWGVAVSGGSADELASAVEAGADFVVVEGENAPGAAIKDDDTGKGFVVGPNVTDERAKAIDSGPFDFLILDGSSLHMPLTVGSALDIQEQLARYRNHVFLQMTELPEVIDLELLRDIGISALIYEASSADSKGLTGLQKKIEALEPRKQKSAGGAVVPSSAEPSSENEAEFDEPDEEDDWE